ncbi:hypothetical protein [Paenibacillus pinihumi]|uniref:hypothetical protein n=1 Tax=Paenibacillus pinihumi TaxID=669462 RepID=UPI0004162CAD|nr:hypothetical protein [Paenibacillus pinihumi]
MVVFFVVLTAVAIGASQAPMMLRNRWFREMAASALFLIAGSILSVIAWKMISVPSPLNILITIYKPVNNFFKLLFS